MLPASKALAWGSAKVPGVWKISQRGMLVGSLVWMYICALYLSCFFSFFLYLTFSLSLLSFFPRVFFFGCLPVCLMTSVMGQGRGDLEVQEVKVKLNNER